MRKLLICFLFFLPMSQALEIDEKLTTRIIKVSATKKTVLLNRGLEDGVVVGDHAKLFLTTGVIARGVVVKASPTRSIWSIYRVIDGDQLIPDKVVNIKIATALKITEDPTKQVAIDNIGAGNDRIVIPLGPDSERGLSKQDQIDLQGLQSEGIMVNSGGKQYFYRNMDTRDSSVGDGRDVLYGQGRSTEFTALVSWSNLSLTEETNLENTDSTTSSVSSLSVGFSLEKYFPEDDGIWRRISLLAFLDLTNSTSETDDANVEDTSTSKTTFGGGVNYHFSDPYKFEHMIFFVSGKLGYVRSNTSTGGIDTTGSGLQMAGGIGIKFYTHSGFGMRLLLDLHTESTKSTNSSNDIETTVTSRGPKIYAGMSYRF